MGVGVDCNWFVMYGECAEEDGAGNCDVEGTGGKSEVVVTCMMLPN